MFFAFFAQFFFALFAVKDFFNAKNAKMNRKGRKETFTSFLL